MLYAVNNRCACPPAYLRPQANPAGRPGCSADSDIALVRRAIQRQSVMLSSGNPRSSRRSDDGRTILTPSRQASIPYPDLVFWVGTAGFEPATPRL